MLHSHHHHLGLRPPQKKIFYHKARHKVVVAGARFGKTTLGLTTLCMSAFMFPRSRNWYICPTRIMAKDIAWEDLKRLLGFNAEYGERGHIINSLNESELRIRLHNGSIIQLMTAQEPDRLRGRGVKFVVFDEFADMDPEVWVAVRPRLGDRRLQLTYGELGRTLFIGTPKGYNHFKDMYDEAMAGTRGNQWQAWKFTSREGGNIDASEIEEARHDLSDREWRQEYEATFESIEGRVYHSFLREPYFVPGSSPDTGVYNHGNIDQSIHDIGGTIIVGMDFNVNPMTATLSTKVRIDRPYLPKQAGYNGVHFEMHTWKEYSISNCNTAKLMEAIRTDYPDRKLVVCPDPSGGSRHTTSANVGDTDHSIILKFGASIYKPKFRTNSDKYNTVNGLMCNSLGHRRKIINPRTCPNLVRGYDGLTYVENSNLADKKSGLDHITDADAYSTLGAFPMVQKTITSTQVVM